MNGDRALCGVAICLVAGTAVLAGWLLPPAAFASGASGADRTAIHYVDAHHGGRATARVLATEQDTDRGQRV